MILYRISNHADLTGKGGELAEGRWHTLRPGKRIVYLSDHPALCLLEMLVQVDRESEMPDSFQLLSAEVPDQLLQKLDPSSLPDAWWQKRTLTQQLGDEFLEERQSPALLIPSALVPIAWNCLLNPLHPEAAALKIQTLGRFLLDPRFSR